MDAADAEGYKPPPEFEEDTREPLVELSLTDSTELWLIQWPINQPPDFDGQELTLKLNNDGHLGSFEGSSGKQYDMVSFASQAPNATVFLSSASETKIVGKISRRVSLVHYPEPNELERVKSNNHRSAGTSLSRSTGTSLTNSSLHFASSSQSRKRRNSLSGSEPVASTRSRQKSSLSEVEEPSRPKKRKHIREPIGSTDQSTRDSGRGHSAVTSSG